MCYPLTIQPRRVIDSDGDGNGDFYTIRQVQQRSRVNGMRRVGWKFVAAVSTEVELEEVPKGYR